MSLHYYTSLTHDVKLALNYKEQTFSVLTPFYQHLTIAIESLKKLGELKVQWNPIGIEKLQFKPKFYLYRKANKTRIRILQNSSDWFYAEGLPSQPDFSKEISCLELRKEFKVTPRDISEDKKRIRIPELVSLFPEDKKFLKVTWGFHDLQLFKNDKNFGKIKSITYKKEEVSFRVIDKQTLELELEITEKQPLFVNNVPVDYEILGKVESFDQLKILKNLSDYKIFYSENKISDKGLEELRLSEIVRELGINEEAIRQFFFMDKPKEKFQPNHIVDSSELEFIVDKPEEYHQKILIYKYKNFALRFEASLKEPNPKEKYLIQLSELESEKDDDPYTTSAVDYFFEPDVEVKEDKGNKYSIDYRNREDGIISLKKDGKPALPPKDSEFLKIEVNTHQIKKQRDSIWILQEKPTRWQMPFLKLFLDRSTANINWGFGSRDVPISEWFVLNRTDQQSLLIQEEQRDFVQKALQTPDFAILEGPPGSGKTTVILELICQVLERGERVLLCGSTHVAIDNVLERLKERELIERLQILPLRIGYEDNISNEVEEFQIDKQVEKFEKLGVKANLVYKAANLVCGTTIGVLQYLPFKETRSEEYPIVPEFDYLIIDECSKTTFQEFLVPALYAKKWILVGDVQQLSPFVDRGQFVNNLRFLDLGKGTLPEGLQSACFKLYLAYQFCNKKQNQSVNKIAFVIHSKEEWGWLQKEIQKREELEQKDARNKTCFLDVM